MSVADKGKVAAVTTLRQCRTTNGEGDAHLCPGVQASPSVRQAWERTSVAVCFSRREGQDRIQVEESPERRAASASSMWRQQRRTRRTGAERTDRSESGMSSSFAVGELLRHAVRRGHMARQRLDELPKLEKEKKEDVAKLMALTI